jgi:hypothetical protein
MDSNLTTHYLAIETDRSRLPELAERGWLAEQAASTRRGTNRPTPVRHWLGTALIGAGRRVQGLPDVAMLPADPTHAH